MDSTASDTGSENQRYWIEYFLSNRANDYMCEVDLDFLTDKFNLTGLQTEVRHYNEALATILDEIDEDKYDEETFDAIERSARHLYGLIHARYIITTRGMAKMLDKYKHAEFGVCPRILCENQPLLPVGITDVPNTQSVKLYCCKCEDIYRPKSQRHASIDGAYFGTSFPHMLLQCHPSLAPQRPIQRYVPRVFGFRVHTISQIHRFQDEQLTEQLNRIRYAEQQQIASNNIGNNQ
ncbi:casein kinase II subunit beta [Ramicandelaber brevisporus]|nr:casein kinase II subunit beta [Ramicandelaber brevisporus]